MARRATATAARPTLPRGMVTETVPLAALHPPERNVRLHPEPQIVELMRAVEMFGQTRPVVIDETGTVLAGNGLVMALQRLGRDTAEALRFQGLSKAAKTKLILSDNKIYSLGHDDYDGIMDLIRGLDDLDIPGFDGGLLASLISGSEATEDALAEFGRMNENEKNDRTNKPVRTMRVGGETVVTCPHCGKPFAITSAAA
jgi:hypothetical protein